MDPTDHPLVDEAPVAHRRRKTQPSRLSPLRCCAWSAALVALVCGAGIAFFFYKVFEEAYRMAAAPHRVHHANETLVFQGPGIADNESQVVRSFFGAKDRGGVERFDLKAAIWAKVGAESEAEQGALLSLELDSLSRSLIPPTPIVDETWTLLYSEDVLKDVEITAKSLRTTQRVTLSQSLLCVLAFCTIAYLPLTADGLSPALAFSTTRRADSKPPSPCSPRRQRPSTPRSTSTPSAHPATRPTSAATRSTLSLHSSRALSTRKIS